MLLSSLFSLVIFLFCSNSSNGQEYPSATGWCFQTQVRGTQNVTTSYCCPGFKIRNINGKDECVAECHQTCRNGFCVAPDKCACFPDHVQNLNGDCVGTCPIQCLNGKCNFDGTFVCKKGYKPLGNICVPHCEGVCGFPWNCTRPGVCECADGYKMVNGACVPECKMGCMYGICIEPGKCLCHGQYKLNSEGVCEASNCMRQCINGTCSEYGQCTCYPHYTLAADDSFRCEPVCENGCGNKKCVAPNICG